MTRDENVISNAEGWCKEQSKNTVTGLFNPHKPFTNMTISFDCGNYEYLDCAASCIGNGSFGRVFRGLMNRTGRAIAIKRMPKMSVKPNELKIMKTINSDFLVGFIDVCMNDHDDSVYIVMELCDNDLDCHLKYRTSGILTPHNLRRLIDNTARGYYALYEHRIVHRDIKPQNILIKYDAHKQDLFENVKISDFGISRILNDEEEHKTLSNVAGTLYYMAPEVGANILRTYQYGHEVDMWSFGCVFYQCITGKAPFDERDMCRMFLFVACDNYDAYDKPELPLGTDEDVVRLVNGLLEIDNTKRTTPQWLYNEIHNWGGSRRFSSNSLYVDDCSSCRSNYSTVDFDETD